MQDGQLNVGVVATGLVASAHIDNWKQVEGAEVVAVCSRSKQRAQNAIESHGLTQAKAYDDYHALLKHDGLDVVCLCTPHYQHPDETIAAAEAGKHIVIEKPVALNQDDLKRMLKAVQDNGVLTSVCFELQWIGSFRNTKAMVERGDLGELFYAEAGYNHGISRENIPGQFTWGHHRVETGGSAMLTAGCHAVDAVLHLMNDRAAKVSAFGYTSSVNRSGYEYHPNAVATMQMESGRIGKANVSLEAEGPYHFPTVVQGTDGTVVDQYYYTRQLPAIHGWNELATDLPASGAPEDHPYKGQFQHFKASIEAGQNPSNDLAAAGHVHDVCYAIDASIAKNGQLVDVETTRP
jgi:predicted dehydrogenase